MESMKCIYIYLYIYYTIIILPTPGHIYNYFCEEVTSGATEPALKIFII